MLKLETYNTVELSKKIELPDIAELMRFPFCSQVDIDELYRHAPENMKKILDMIPLRNNSKYISINTSTQLLSPSTTSAPRANWHFDGDSFKEDKKTTIHLLVSKCEAVTEFVENEIILEDFDEDSFVGDVEIAMNNKLNLIKPISAEAEKFITFDGCRHLHRAVRPSYHEFRFMMRVMESDVINGSKFEHSQFFNTEVYDDGIDDYSKIDLDYIRENKTKSYASIEKDRDSDKVVFYFN